MQALAGLFPKLPAVGATQGTCYPERDDLREAAMRREREDPLVYGGPMKLATAVTFKQRLLDADVMQFCRPPAPLLLQVRWTDGPTDRSAQPMPAPDPRTLVLSSHSCHVISCVIQHGTGDRCVRIEGSRALAKQLPHAELVEYAGACHSLMTEDAATRARYLTTSVAWCLARLAPS